MKAAILHGPRDLRVETAREPRPESGDVVVRIVAAGLCGTDYRIWTGERPVAYPRVMGHELVGHVEAVASDVTRVRSGDRVVVEPNYACGRCPLCREGNRNLCLTRTAIGIDVDGGFAELVRLPARCCWPAPPAAGPDALLLTEPLAVVVRAVERGAPRRGEAAAIVGAGTLRLLALPVLRARGARVLRVSRSPHRLPLPSRLGPEGAHPTGDGRVRGAGRPL